MGQIELLWSVLTLIQTQELDGFGAVHCVTASTVSDSDLTNWRSGRKYKPPVRYAVVVNSAYTAKMSYGYLNYDVHQAWALGQQFTNWEARRPCDKI